jgi:molybdopterin-guanine dinucleotide biosynthesis protein A
MGTNKAFMSHLGYPFVHILVELLRVSFTEVFLIGKDEATYSGLGVPFLKDIYPKNGAAIGIASGLQASKNDWMFFCAVDMPLINQGILRLLIESVKNQKNSMAIVPRIRGQLEPLCAIYHKRFVDILRMELKTGGTPSLRYLLKGSIAHQFDVPDSLTHSLTNINTPMDYERLGSTSPRFNR